MAVHVALLASEAVAVESVIADPPPGTDIAVVAWGASSAEALTTMPRRSGPGDRLARLASRWTIGRVLVRLTPLDPGVRFWVASKREQSARAVIERADVLIAVDRDTVYAAWRWMRMSRRRGRQVSAVFGYPAGRAIISAGAEA